jgi:hypothetical protein
VLGSVVDGWDLRACRIWALSVFVVLYCVVFTDSTTTRILRQKLNHYLKGAREVQCDRHAGGRTDGHDEGNSRCSQFCERA